jgi:kynurenine 3-monooxygenase
VESDILFGCDGAHSNVRSQLQKWIRGFEIEQRYMTHSYKELTIPPTKENDFALTSPNSLHIWPRGDFMLMALPNKSKNFTVTLFMVCVYFLISREMNILKA